MRSNQRGFDWLEFLGNVQMDKKIIISLVLITLFSMSTFAPTVLGVTTEFFGMSTYGVSKSQFDLIQVRPGGSWAEAQRYYGNNQYLSEIQFMVNIVGSPTGSLSAALINATSPYTIIENSSNTVSTTEITTADTWINFVFSETTLISDSQLYFYAVYVSDDSTFDVANHAHAIGDGSSGVPNNMGTKFSASAGAWTQGGTQDLCMRVYTTTELGGGSEEEQTSLTQMDEIMSGLAAFLLPLLVLLLPALLLIFFTRRTDKWLLLIGLAIGAGLGYYFGLIPVWLVFLVSIGLIGLAYSEVRRNG